MLLFSKFTTVGTRVSFGEWIFKVESFLKFRLKMDYAAACVLSLSYSKAFICRPCHTFWMVLIAHLLVINWYLSVIAALLAYGVAINVENHAKKQAERRNNRKSFT